jgi:ribosomal protein S27AE
MFGIPSSPHLICPRCGTYNATLNSTIRRWELFLWFMSTYLIIPAFFLGRYYKERDEELFFAGKNKATCRTCGYTFRIHQVDLLPLDMAKRKFAHHLGQLKEGNPHNINLN